MKNPAIRNDGTGDWPYQITTVDLTRFIDKFPNIAPPPNSINAIKYSFLIFRSLCIKCHSINGEGGTLGQDLNYPVNVTEYWMPKMLEKWILDPRQVRYNATMPSLGMMSKDATAISQAI